MLPLSRLPLRNLLHAPAQPTSSRKRPAGVSGVGIIYRCSSAFGAHTGRAVSRPERQCWNLCRYGAKAVRRSGYQPGALDGNAGPVRIVGSVKAAAKEDSSSGRGAWRLGARILFLISHHIELIRGLPSLLGTIRLTGRSGMRILVSMHMYMCREENSYGGYATHPDSHES